ncbi:hypothetical protein N7540_011459 [Penicillium herquei]|nr:hypothetical protein N7540_011459 [Penicillium herquei]
MSTPNPPSTNLSQEGRLIKRPRLALTCLRCRRRKVRCGKEQPQCINCRRAREECVYSTGSRNPVTGGVIHAMEVDHTNRSSNIDSPAYGDSGETPTEVTGTGHSVEATIGLPPRFYRLQWGHQCRYIGTSFWGAVNGGEKLIAALTDCNQEPSNDLPPCYISTSQMANHLLNIPTQLQCDALINQYLMAVHPVYELLPMGEFFDCYRLFWGGFKGDGPSAVPARIVKDPTFFCVFWAVLFASALTAPESFWESSALHGTNRGQTISCFRDSCTESLLACRHMEHPTLNTIVASVIHFHFTKHNSPQSATFVASTLRLAQMLGLDRERNTTYPSPDHEGSIWTHLICLDLEVSLWTGLDPCLAPVDEIECQVIFWTSELLSERNFNLISARSYIQCLVARLQILFIHQTRKPKSIPVSILSRHIHLIKLVCDSISQLIDLIPVLGVPERGMIPSRLANPSVEAGSESYSFRKMWPLSWPIEPTIGGTWSRLVLSLVKLELVITYQRMFLPPPNDMPASGAWNSTVTFCLRYLQIFTHLCRTPAFSPYLWFHSKYYCPQQCAFLILIFLKNNPLVEPEREAEMKYYVDELLDFCVRHTSANSSSSGTQHSQELDLEMPKSLTALTSLRNGLASGSRDNTRMNPPTFAEFISSPEEKNGFNIDGTKELFDMNTWLGYLPPAV